jgi:DNA-binding transcriptional MerR regulator
MDTSTQKNYGIGDISLRLNVPAYTLRYWEKEFKEFLNPQRSNGRRRIYGDYELSLLKRIRTLLWDEKYSIAGARQKLRGLLVDGKESEKQEILSKIVDFIKTNNIVTL